MILKTPNVWGTRKNGVCPCSPLLGTPASSYNRPIDIGKNKWGTANHGLDSLLLKIGRQHILISLCPEYLWLPTLDLTASSTTNTQDILSLSLSAAPLTKVCLSQGWGHIPLMLVERKLMQDHRRVQSQQEYPVRTFVKNEGGKPYQISFFLCYSVRNSVTYHLFTFHPSEYKNAL